MARGLVLGVGNFLLADDGAGVHAALKLKDRAGSRPDLTILDAGTLSFTLLPALEEADALIAIDAARCGGSPGDLRICEGEEFDRFVRRSGRSVHEIGLADLVDMARLSGRLPERRALIGVEPEVVDWGFELSAPVSTMKPDERSRLASIPVVTEAAGAPALATQSGNVPLLLAEIRHALERLLASGTVQSIDLRAIPLGPGEEPDGSAGSFSWASCAWQDRATAAIAATTPASAAGDQCPDPLNPKNRVIVPNAPVLL